jgi:hypothetical protein
MSGKLFAFNPGRKKARSKALPKKAAPAAKRPTAAAGGATPQGLHAAITRGAATSQTALGRSPVSQIAAAPMVSGAVGPFFGSAPSAVSTSTAANGDDDSRGTRRTVGRRVSFGAAQQQEFVATTELQAPPHDEHAQPHDEPYDEPHDELRDEPHDELHTQGFVDNEQQQQQQPQPQHSYDSLMGAQHDAHDEHDEHGGQNNYDGHEGHDGHHDAYDEQPGADRDESDDELLPDRAATEALLQEVRTGSAAPCACLLCFSVAHYLRRRVRATDA